MAEKIFLVRTGDMSDGSMRQVCLADKKSELAVFRVKGEFYVTDDLCTHGMVALTGGDLEGTTVYCPLHGGAFDVCTGRATEKPCTTPLKTYQVVMEAEDVYCMYDD
ncbi:Ferredoxin CarAc [Paraburkholderia unamae]|uniref:non-heme iron oxygenase ferredoxin subunit n=1 Tax=Paraburkholderia unamae TaxID=219649 RepID=UPI001CACC385|nr:non-heme iron oxygenase ferredoxin subunit [Paraburkholderia unamae]CAG9243229.1 Ferredoxin CarAc [Paraburkholderia unamae]